MAERVNDFEPRMSALDDGQLRALTGLYRDRVSRGESLDALLPEAFAAVREAASQTLGERPYDTQVMGAAALHRGTIAEMLTGEGKTLTAVLTAYLHALTGAGAHVMTANDHLARRDAEWMRPVYEFLGLTVELLQPASEIRSSARRAAYSADVTYGTPTQFAFDYLYDSTADNPSEMVHRGWHSALVDEADLILIDQGFMEPGLAGRPEPARPRHAAFAALAATLRAGEHYRIVPGLGSLTDSGIRAAEDYFGIGSLYAESSVRLVYYLQNAITAKERYQRDRDYLVRDGKIVAIDSVTGRPRPERPYAEGIHVALAAKEGLKVRGERQVAIDVPVWDYLSEYERLAGMTGTARGDTEMYRQVYRLDVVPVPTHKPVIRTDHPDVVYATREAKLDAVAEETAKRHATGQPVLIGTPTIEEAQSVSSLLGNRHIRHEVLTALNHEEEARIIAAAGAPAAVTVVAKMAGRGVNIPLGGADGAERERVADLGGLYVLGTERPLLLRPETHLRGRAGRRGDPGESQFFLSWDDDMLIRCTKPYLLALHRRVNQGAGLEMSILSKQLTKFQADEAEIIAQRLARELLWDQVLTGQRRALYAERAPAAHGEDMSERIRTMIGQVPAFSLEDYGRREAELGSYRLRALERQMVRDILDESWQYHLQAMHDLRRASQVRGAGPDTLARYRIDAAKLYEEMLATAHRSIVDRLFRPDPDAPEPEQTGHS